MGNPAGFAAGSTADGPRRVGGGGRGDVVIPDTVSYIGDNAFANNPDVTSVALPGYPSLLRSIGSGAFSGCTGLTSIWIPGPVEEVGCRAFYGCTNLTEVTIEYCSLSYNLGVMEKNIQDSAFENCTSLSSLDLSNDVAYIGARAFAGCTSLTEVKTPMYIVRLGSGAFSGCKALKDVYVQRSGWNAPSDQFEGCASGLTFHTTCQAKEINAWAVEKGYAVDSKPHEVTHEEAREATCTEDGWEAYDVCHICFTYLTPCKEIPALGHDWIVDKPLVEPTCTEDGLTEARHCSRCSEKQAQEVIPAQGHEWVECAYMAPTCTETGMTAGRKCKACGLSTCEDIPALGHSSVRIQGVAPTCTEAGTRDSFKCVTCGQVISGGESIPANGHTAVTDKAVAATCTSTGLTKGSHCEVCGKVLKAQKTVAKKAHTAVTDKAVAATCTSTGLTEGSHCKVCGKVLTKQKTVAKVAHTAVKDKAVAATCTSTGLTEGSHCKVCGKVLTKQKTVAKAAHTAVKDKAVAATYTSTGLTEGRHCKVCSKVLKAQKTVPKLVLPENGVLLTGNATRSANVGEKLMVVLNGIAVKKYKSSNIAVATVSQKGLVTVKKKGTAKITLTPKKGKALTLTLKVVAAPTGLSFKEGKETTIRSWQTLKLTPVFKPAKSSSKLTWKCSDTRLAMVDENGIVYPKGSDDGTVTITATTLNGVKATFKVKLWSTMAGAGDLKDYLGKALTVMKKKMTMPMYPEDGKFVYVSNGAYEVKLVAEVSSKGKIKSLELTGDSKSLALFRVTTGMSRDMVEDLLFKQGWKIQTEMEDYTVYTIKGHSMVVGYDDGYSSSIKAR